MIQTLGINDTMNEISVEFYQVVNAYIIRTVKKAKSIKMKLL